MLSDSFPPISRCDAQTLILGSLPGPLSLTRRQYYAMPQNAFWRIMGDLFAASPELPYDERLARLIGQRIAVWDVCATAFRTGALDAAIQPSSIVPNDFKAFFAAHPDVALVACNGAKAAEIYARKVLPTLSRQHRSIRLVRLPSTSPAHAGMPYAEKLRHWREGLRAGDATMATGSD